MGAHIGLGAIDPLLAWIAVGVIAALFGHAAAAKLMDRSLFTQHLAAYGVPEATRPLLVWAVPLLEAATAVLLLTPGRVVAAALGLSLLLAYGAAMGWHLVRGHVLDCGCGGAPLAVSWALVTRNAVLAVIAAAGLWPVAQRALGLGDFLAVAALLPLAVLLYAALHEVLRHQHRVAARNSLKRI